MSQISLGTLSYNQLSRFVGDIEEAQRRNDARLMVNLQKQHITYLVLIEFASKYGRNLFGQPTTVDPFLVDLLGEQLAGYANFNHPLSGFVAKEREKLIDQAKRAGMLFSDGKLVAYGCPPDLVAEVTQ
jgi:hypothetical protein